MLVLSRKVGERIHVGDDIVLEIRRIAGNRVTVAIDAPRNVRILRGELEQAAREFECVDHREMPGEDATAPSAPNNAAALPPMTVAFLDELAAEPVGHPCGT
ncbi:MAG: carbon storage regulator [Pirellulales bacterium]|nr:carbon storage regulator [Pirellulales bacterium]